jgi:DNA helicase-2/ATP-dependent DNA helicase PcrA
MAYSLSSLNPEQRKAVETTEGPLLLLAGAGSGKTRVITHRIAYLIERRNVKPSQILAVTFTNKAAQEMKSRIGEMLNNKPNGLVVSTFHSLGARILRGYIDRIGYKRNFTICSESEKITLIKRVMETLPGKRSFDPKYIAHTISRIKNSDPENSESNQNEEWEQIAEIFRIYHERMRLNNLVDFDDLLILPLKIFRESPETLEQLRKRFLYFLVDEYQDTNRIQYRLITLLAGGSRNLCVVGDDDQSIYGWRGADDRNIRDFEKDWPEAKIIKLEQNYRSTDVILKAANSIIGNNQERRKKRLWSAIKGGDPIIFFGADTPEAEAEEIVNRIRLLQHRQHASLGDIAVLYRRNAQSRPIEETLRLNQIPYRLIGSTNFFERREIRDIFTYLNVIVNPSDEISLSEALMVPKRGIGSQTLQRIRQYSFRENLTLMDAMRKVRDIRDINESKMKPIENFTEIITDLHHKQVHLPPSKLIRELLTEIEYDKYLKTVSREETEYLRRNKAVSDFIRSVEHYEQKVSRPSLVKYLERMALITREDRQDDPGHSQVTLMTIHAAKGLEFDFVFLPGMEEGVFPSRLSLEEGKISEERRLFYVAVTRAKKQLFLSAVKERKIYGESNNSALSRFLGEIPEEVYHRPPGKADTQKEKEKRNKEAARLFFQRKKELLG